MTKAELIDRIARSRDLPPDITKKCIAEILDVAFEELSTYFVRARITKKSTPRFTMPGFGTFTKKRRAPRKGVNPQTLEPMEIPGYDTLDFKPGSELKQALAESRGTKSRRNASRKKTGKASTSTKAKSKTKSTKSKGSASKKTKRAAKAGGGRRASSIAGRRLKRREELEYTEFDELALPEAPMQRSRGRRKRKIDVDSTG